MTSSRSARLPACILVASLVFFANPALARPQEGDEARREAPRAAPETGVSSASGGALLATLARQVRELQAQVARLEKELRLLQDGRTREATTSESAVPAPAPPESAAPAVPHDDEEPDADGSGRAGEFQLESGDLSVAVGGYGSFRLDVVDSAELADSLTLRRFIVTTDAHYGDRLQAYAEIEFERLSEIEIERGVSREAGGLEFEQELEGPNASEIALEQAWGQFNLAPELGLRVGAVLPPVGRFNLRHDDDQWNFPRRPLIDRGANVLPAGAAWTEMGIGAVGEAEVGETTVLSYEAYVLNGAILDFAIEEKVQTRVPQRNKLLLEAVVSPTSGAFDGSNPTDAVAGRLQVSPTLGTEIAVSGYHGEYTPGYLDASGSVTTLGVDGAHRAGPFRLEGEFLYSRWSNVDEILTDFAAVAVDHATETESDETATLESEIEIALDGVSERRHGFWFDVGYPLAMEPGFLGLDNAVFIPSVRYERVWFGDNVEAFDFSAGQVTELVKADRQQERLFVGLAFRPAPLAVFHLFYERNSAVEGFLLAPAVGETTTNAFTFGMAMGF